MHLKTLQTLGVGSNELVPPGSIIDSSAYNLTNDEADRLVSSGCCIVVKTPGQKKTKGSGVGQKTHGSD